MTARVSCAAPGGDSRLGRSHYSFVEAYGHDV